MNYSYDYYKKSADYILDKVDYKPEIAIILGSCLGPLADSVKNQVIINYEDIPNFLTSTAPDHAGKLILGDLCGKKVVCMSGRFHYYEGYEFEQLVIPIRVLKVLGVRTTVLTNAAGAINTSYKPGDVMIIKDHVKFMGASPLRGKNIEEFGPRFFDVGDMYTSSLRKIAVEQSKKSELTVHEGVYYYWAGPQFETPAEIKALSILGADAVGMSTVTESLTAAHCGMNLLGLSLITNMAAGISQQPITDEEVEQIASKASQRLVLYVEDIVKEL